MEKFLQLAISLVAIILLARLAMLLSNRWGTSPVALQLLFGILLGPSLFNLLGAPVVLGSWGSVSTGPLHSILKIFGEVGLIQLMFLAGLESDWPGMKALFKPIFSIGGWGFALTAASVTVFSLFFMQSWPHALAVGAILGASSFGMTVYNLTRTPGGRTPSASAIEGGSALAGFLAVLLMVAALAGSYQSRFGGLNTALAVSWFLGKLIMFFALAYFLFSRFLSRGAGNVEKRAMQMLIGYLLLVAALYAWASLHFGSFASAMLAALGGALLAVSRWGVKEKVAGGLQSPTASIPIGIFFILAGMEVNLKEAGSQSLFFFLLFSVAGAAKLAGSWWGTKGVLDSSHERVRIMLGILPPGEIGLLVAVYLFSRGLVDPPVYNGVITVVVVLTGFSAGLLKAGFFSVRDGKAA